MFIYVVTNQINGKVYVGQTIQHIKDRWISHKSDARIKRREHYFSAALVKYGFENFSIEEVFSGETQGELDYAEKLLIVALNSTNPEKGYNIREGGSRGAHSEQTKERLRQLNLGKKLSDKTKKLLSDKGRGRVWITNGSNNSMSLPTSIPDGWIRGRVNVESGFSIWRRSLNYSPARKGKTHTESAKEKNRVAHLGKPSKLKGIPLSSPIWNKGLRYSIVERKAVLK